MQNRRRVYFFEVIVFLAGILIGACGMHFFAREYGRQTPAPRPQRERGEPRSPQERAESVAARLRERYKLPAEQQTLLTAAFQDFFKSAAAAQTEIMSQMQALHTVLENCVREILPPEAFAEWQQESAHRFPPRSRERNGERPDTVRRPSSEITLPPLAPPEK